MRRILHLPSLIVTAALASAIAYGGSIWIDLEFWIGFVVAFVALLIIGWLAVFEDEKLGGFNNPRDKGE